MERVPQVKKFHDKIKMNKLKTFSDMNKKKIMSNGRSVIIKADQSLFGRIIVMEDKQGCSGYITPKECTGCRENPK
jgi:hypothetical protein